MSRTRQFRYIHERMIAYDSDLNGHTARLSRQTLRDSALINRSNCVRGR